MLPILVVSSKGHEDENEEFNRIVQSDGYQSAHSNFDSNTISSVTSNKPLWTLTKRGREAGIVSTALEDAIGCWSEVQLATVKKLPPHSARLIDESSANPGAN
ncbi:hypothetical protein N7522_013421 [Penicillium canescens]|uniref:Uncharacterized protein n=1 Tax=Penicillium canescens TaxID=5083 RepID=A0AAD6NEZ6_PENCN|nr:uncharacterized protein N7446_008824 [Penicillium canescens]KAJ5981793.1 hypothetical protein N7522_013421 [Penicillium canescens]KAJ6057926.1 hypothetical protein N7460_001200 [Penicillium canescens]KAJ6059241.1 hypothetical protein N7446_008824 [Penicillium canescens]